MSGGETHAELTEIFLCKLHRGDRRELGNKRGCSVQECVYVFMYACLLVCAHRRPRGMEGIPCSLLRRWRDLEEGAGHWLSWRDCQSSEEETQQVSHNIHIPYASHACVWVYCVFVSWLWETCSHCGPHEQQMKWHMLLLSSSLLLCVGRRCFSGDDVWVLVSKVNGGNPQTNKHKKHKLIERETQRETEVLTATNSGMCFLCVLSSLLPVPSADTWGDCTRPAGVKGLEDDTSTETHKHTVHNTTPHIHIKPKTAQHMTRRSKMQTNWQQDKSRFCLCVTVKTPPDWGNDILQASWGERLSSLLHSLLPAGSKTHGSSYKWEKKRTCYI